MYISHKTHDHPATPAARKACRKETLAASEAAIQRGVDREREEYQRDEALCFAMGISEKDWYALGNQAQRIIGLILPQFVARFVEKSLHYGPTNANVLGPAGQFADISRKVGPLKRALWDGVESNVEPPEEICKDLIGHLFLTMDMLEQGVGRRGTG
jgi:hypothetical protein